MLTRRQTQQFHRWGYCLAEGMLQARDFAQVTADCERVLDALCRRMRAAGELRDDYAGLPFTERYLRASGEAGGALAQHFTIALPMREVRADTPLLLAPSVFELLRHAAIVDAVEALLGPEIAASPVGNARIKPPERVFAHDTAPDPNKHERPGLFRATPWHQDNGVITADGDATPMVTVWFSLTDAPLEAGCLQVLPGSHRHGLVPHCPDENGELSIPPDCLPPQKPLPLPMRAGDVLFLHRRLCHASLPNLSAAIRWSFDLRYIPAHAPSGRALYPSVIVRSRADPASALTNAADWAQRWRDARARVAGKELPSHLWNRWSADAAPCA